MPTQAAAFDSMMNWNAEKIPVAVALRIGWNLPMDVVGAGVYGGIIKRDASSGSILIGDEWPEDNRAPPVRNQLDLIIHAVSTQCLHGLTL